METVTNVPFKTTTKCVKQFSLFSVLHFLLGAVTPVFRPKAQHQRFQRWFKSAMMSLWSMALSTSNGLTDHFALAYKEALAGPIAASKASSVHRIFLGLAIIIIAAPLSENIYSLCDYNAVDRTWYHRSWWDYFRVICPYLHDIVFSIGVLFVLPKQFRIAIISGLIWPVTKIIWLSKATSNYEFNANPSFMYWLIGIVFSIALFSIFNYLMTLHYHKILGTVARLVNLMRTPGIDDATRLKDGKIEADNYVALINK